MNLYPYQKTFVNNIVKSTREHQKTMAVLPTGGGKTFCFSAIIEYLIKKDHRILILVHKEELVKQTVKSLNKFGISSEIITSRTKKAKHYCNVYTAMVETAHRRLSKNDNFFGHIDYVIADEAHIRIFEKVQEMFKNSKHIGFTGTPVHLSRDKFFRCNVCNSESKEPIECCGSEMIEWSKPFSFSNTYDNVVVGTKIDELIKDEKLVREISIVKQTVDIDGIKIDKDGEFNEVSQSKIFAHEKSIDSLIDDYLTLSKGKKTLLFTPSTKINPLIHAKLVERGINAKMYDSVNNGENRAELMEWFESNRDAVLINTGVFTTGLDVTDIEAIILYRATMSLSLFIQMVGRGGRTTNKIYKDQFLLVDYGGNIERFGEWSDPNRDWEHIFYNGIGKEQPKKENIEAVEICVNCGFMFTRIAGACPNCGEKIPQKKEKQITPEGYKLVPIVDMPPPNGKKIVEYSQSQEQGVAFAFRVMIGQICDLFRFYSVSKEQYERAKKSGELDKKINKMIRSCYFEIIKSKLAGGNRTLDAISKITKEKIEKIYNPTNL